MKRALIVIDYTNDFVTGALPCGEPGINIEGGITALTEDFIASEDLVIFAVDLHYEGDSYHPETALYPPHNIAGTDGRKLYGELEEIFEKNKHKQHVKWIDKTRYSAFAGTNIELLLKERGIEELHLVGVCTDICVLHTAVDAYNKGFKLHIHKNAVATFNEAGHEWALSHFKNTLNANII